MGAVGKHDEGTSQRRCWLRGRIVESGWTRVSRKCPFSVFSNYVEERVANVDATWKVSTQQLEKTQFAETPTRCESCARGGQTFRMRVVVRLSRGTRRVVLFLSAHPFSISSVCQIY